MCGIPTTIDAELERMLNEYLDGSEYEQAEPDYVTRVIAYEDGQVAFIRCYEDLFEAYDYVARHEYTYERIEVEYIGDEPALPFDEWLMSF